MDLPRYAFTDMTSVAHTLQCQSGHHVVTPEMGGGREGGSVDAWVKAQTKFCPTLTLKFQVSSQTSFYHRRTVSTVSGLVTQLLLLAKTPNHHPPFLPPSLPACLVCIKKNPQCTKKKTHFVPKKPPNLPKKPPGCLPKNPPRDMKVYQKKIHFLPKPPPQSYHENTPNLTKPPQKPYNGFSGQKKRCK